MASGTPWIFTPKFLAVNDDLIAAQGFDYVASAAIETCSELSGIDRLYNTKYRVTAWNTVAEFQQSGCLEFFLSVCNHIRYVVTVLTITQHADECHSEHILEFMFNLSQVTRVFYFAENFYLHTSNITIFRNICNIRKFISHNQVNF